MEAAERDYEGFLRAGRAFCAVARAVSERPDRLLCGGMLKARTPEDFRHDVWEELPNYNFGGVQFLHVDSRFCEIVIAYMCVLNAPARSVYWDEGLKSENRTSS